MISLRKFWRRLTGAEERELDRKLGEIIRELERANRAFDEEHNKAQKARRIHGK